MGSPRLLAVAVAVTVGYSSAARGQNVTVQQPVFNNFSVSTTVSVPDRGSAWLGGVKRAGSSRKAFGPLRSGPSIGLFRDHSGVSVRATVHDLDAMDRRVLGGAPHSGDRPERAILRGSAADAYRTLADRHRRSSTRHAAGAAQPSSRGRSRYAASEDRSAVISAARSYRLGKKAEERGSVTVARLHYRMAARLGSDRAAARLEELRKR